MALIFNCSIESAANALHLKKMGQEYHGPCPICGGTDRFWIKQGQDGINVHCRQGCEFRDLARNLRNSGIAVKSEFPPERQRVHMSDATRIYADVYISLFRSSESPTERDKSILAGLIHRVDESRRKTIVNLLKDKTNGR